MRRHLLSHCIFALILLPFSWASMSAVAQEYYGCKVNGGCQSGRDSSRKYASDETSACVDALNACLVVTGPYYHGGVPETYRQTSNDAAFGGSLDVNSGTCPEGEVFSYDDQACIPETCPAGTSSLSVTIGGTTTTTCAIDLPGGNCDNVLGTFNGQEICADAQDDCESQGGTYGFVGDPPVETCLPPDFPNPPPDCGDLNVYWIDSNSYICTDAEVDDSQNTPNQSETPEPDLDGDGIPDHQDDDIDGDGTPNSSDTDTDGDGVADGDDIDPNGEQQAGEESSVTGGGTCDVAPRCTGDAIQCAILYQTWETRCASSDYGTQEELDNATAGNDPASLWGDDVDLESTLSGVYNQTGGTASCPAPLAINLSSGTHHFDYVYLCDLATYLRPLVLIGFSFLAFVAVMRAF